MDSRKDVAAGMVGVQSSIRNSKQMYYRLSQKRKLMSLHGTDEQNVHDIQEFIKDEVKEACILPLERWILMSDETRGTVKSIIDAIEKRYKDLEKNGQSTASPPLVFHYDTTFNVGDKFVSILTIRDPTKERTGIKNSGRHVFVEPILPVAVMVHQGRRREQHESFFNVVDKQLDTITMGAFNHIKKVIICDHEFGNVWKSAETIFCKTHMERNVKEFLRKNNLSSKKDSREVLSQFHSLMNSKTFDKFISLKKKLEDGDFNKGALAVDKVRQYLLNNIVPKIQHNSGRYPIIFNY